MRFTTEQYDRAIMALELAKTQLEANGHCCQDGGHQAWECPWNPLRAVATCNTVADYATRLHRVVHASDRMASSRRWPETPLTDLAHRFLHFLSGFDIHFGQGVGPRHIHLPEATPITESEISEHRRILAIERTSRESVTD